MNRKAITVDHSMSDEPVPFPHHGRRLKALRLAHDLNSTEFPKRAGISRGAYNHWEHGRHRIGIDKAIALGRVYNVSLDYIFTGRMNLVPHELAVKIEEQIRRLDEEDPIDTSPDGDPTVVYLGNNT